MRSTDESSQTRNGLLKPALQPCPSRWTKFEAKIDNLMWEFPTFGVGVVLVGVGAVGFTGRRLIIYFRWQQQVCRRNALSRWEMKDDMLESVKTLITASEASIKDGDSKWDPRYRGQNCAQIKSQKWLWSCCLLWLDGGYWRLCWKQSLLGFYAWCPRYKYRLWTSCCN